MFDIIFISYQEPNAEANWKALKERFPMAKRVHGVKGIHQAHIQAANKSFTKMFYVVDGDAEIVDDFNFDHKVSEWDLDCVHVWRSRNPINDLFNHGILATEALIEIFLDSKLLHCNQIYASGKECPQSFSIYPFPLLKFTSLLFIFKDPLKL